MVGPLIRASKSRLIIVGVILAVSAVVATYWILVRRMQSCMTDTVQRIAGNGLYDVHVTEEGCDGIVGSDTVYVQFISRKTGTKRTVFSYGREAANGKIPLRDTYPRLTWKSKSRLQVSVASVSYIDKKLSRVDGIQIEYHIGEVKYK